MIESISHLWEIMTIFFTFDVIYQPLFMAMILLNTIFFAVYFLKDLLDADTWGVRF